MIQSQETKPNKTAEDLKKIYYLCSQRKEVVINVPGVHAYKEVDYKLRLDNTFQ